MIISAQFLWKTSYWNRKGISNEYINIQEKKIYICRCSEKKMDKYFQEIRNKSSIAEDIKQERIKLASAWKALDIREQNDQC